MTSKELVIKFFDYLSIPLDSIDVVESPEVIEVTLTVSEVNSGLLIGYRGEKIDALQKILTLMLNNQSIAFKPVNLDINSYRQKRIDQLHDIANTAITKAVQSGREILLPPMPARERRIIHLHLSSRSDVSSYSEGEGSSRRIVVRPEVDVV